jgi:hypothetical protein
MRNGLLVGLLLVWTAAARAGGDKIYDKSFQGGVPVPNPPVAAYDPLAGALVAAPAAVAAPTDGEEAALEFLYRQLLGRGVDPAGRAGWLPVLRERGPAAVMVGILQSDEYRQKH